MDCAGPKRNVICIHMHIQSIYSMGKGNVRIRIGNMHIFPFINKFYEYTYYICELGYPLTIYCTCISTSFVILLAFSFLIPEEILKVCYKKIRIFIISDVFKYAAIYYFIIKHILMCVMHIIYTKVHVLNILEQINNSFLLLLC